MDNYIRVKINNDYVWRVLMWARRFGNSPARIDVEPAVMLLVTYGLLQTDDSQTQFCPVFHVTDLGRNCSVHNLDLHIIHIPIE